MRASLLLLPVLFAAAPASAQALIPGPAPTLTVIGNATVKIAPDLARLYITIRGEGTTADAASKDLARRQDAIRNVLASLDPKLRFYTDTVNTGEHREGDCMDKSVQAPARPPSTDGDRGEGKAPCRVIGYTASVQASVEMQAIDKAGTAVGLAQREGAVSARLGGFEVADPAAAQRTAQVAAFKDARMRAEALAAAAGARIARIESLSSRPEDGEFMMYEPMPGKVAVYGNVMPPVPIDVSPKPYEASAQLTVTFSLKE